MSEKVKTNMFGKFDDICEKYVENASEVNLNTLLTFYQRLVPNWVRDFNDLNRRLLEESGNKGTGYDEFLNVQLPADYSVKRLKVRANAKRKYLYRYNE